jgi:hypothetical protein
MAMAVLIYCFVSNYLLNIAKRSDVVQFALFAVCAAQVMMLRFFGFPCGCNRALVTFVAAGKFFEALNQ